MTNHRHYDRRGRAKGARAAAIEGRRPPKRRAAPAALDGLISDDYLACLLPLLLLDAQGEQAMKEPVKDGDALPGCGPGGQPRAVPDPHASAADRARAARLLMAQDLGRPTLYVKGQNDAADGPLATCTDDEVEELLALSRQAKAAAANAEQRDSATGGLKESDGGDTPELRAPSGPE